MTEETQPTLSGEKRKVTMTSVFARPGGAIETHKAEDYVPVEILDKYVADARGTWQNVEVGDTHDPGPGGDDGETVIPQHLLEV